MNEFNSLADFLDKAWQLLGRGVADRRAPSRHPTFATVSPRGDPEARTVVLRAADREMATLDVHTDTKSAKFEALKKYPAAELHIWEPKPRIQIRLLTEVELLTEAITLSAWDKVPPKSRDSYGIEPAPGSAIAGAFEYTKTPDQSRFSVLRCSVKSIDLLHLGDQHQRAKYLRSDNWQGTWLAP
ncbi:MAG: pyridoxamine 5'-phosphate oxidase family protein [Pseudomonadota bacterium]